MHNVQNISKAYPFLKWEKGLMYMRLKLELKVNNQERSKLAQCAGVARHSYNLALSLTRSVLRWNAENPDDKILFPSGITLNLWITRYIKPEFPWYYEVSSDIHNHAVHHLYTAWQRYFRGISGKPRFKKKGKHDSFTVHHSVKVRGCHKIQLPRLGQLRTYEELPQVFPIKSATIYCNGGKWFISLLLDLPVQPTKKANLSVGVDLGLLHFATLSNGQVFDSPKQYQALRQRISDLQRLQSRKVKDSRAYKKIKAQIKKLHYRLFCIRNDWLHKLTSYLAQNFEMICIEDLNITGMLKNKNISRIMSEMGFYTFRRMLVYKCEWYGSSLKIIDRWFPSSQIHHACDYRNHHLKLNDRVFYCPNCNESIDRDLNAALNIQRFGLGQSS